MNFLRGQHKPASPKKNAPDTHRIRLIDDFWHVGTVKADGTGFCSVFQADRHAKALKRLQELRGWE